MPRPPRVLAAGGWYHVTNRGAARQDIYRDDLDRNRYLQLLEESVGIHKIEIHAYCLMGNHFHLLIRSPLPNLDLAMHRLLSIYGREFNRKYGRDGPVFTARYHSTTIEDERYLFAVTRYIHRNPKSFGVEDFSSYKWSSFGIYSGRRRSPYWFSAAFTRELFGSRQAHVAFVQLPFDSEIDRLLSSDRPPTSLAASDLTALDSA